MRVYFISLCASNAFVICHIKAQARTHAQAIKIKKKNENSFLICEIECILYMNKINSLHIYVYFPHEYFLGNCFVYMYNIGIYKVESNTQSLSLMHLLRKR